MGRLLLLFFLFISISVTAQGNAIFFSEALDVYLPKYIQDAEAAIRSKQQDQVKELFDKLVDDALVGTYMDNFKANKLNKNEIEFLEFEKPLVLLTYTSWLIPSKGEIPALNAIAKTYDKEIDFVVLFWDNQKMARKRGREFNGDIEILYADETDNTATKTIKNLKHSLGLPLVFTMNSKKEIINIKRRIPNVINEDNENAYEKNYTLFKDLITQLLYKEKEITGDAVVGY